MLGGPTGFEDPLPLSFKRCPSQNSLFFSVSNQGCIQEEEKRERKEEGWKVPAPSNVPFFSHVPSLEFGPTSQQLAASS